VESIELGEIRSMLGSNLIPRSVHETLQLSARKFPNNPAIIFNETTYTFSKIDRLSSIFASALLASGLKDGDRVACYLPSSPAFMIVYYGTLKAGGVLTPIDHRYREVEVKYQLKDSGSKIIVTLDSLWEKLAGVIKEAGVEKVILTNPDESLIASQSSTDVQKTGETSRLTELLGTFPPLANSADVDPFLHLAAMPYTTGTTGPSKGVMLSHYNLLASQVQFNHALQNSTGKETALVVFPFSHIGGLNAAMGTLVHSSNTIIAFERFDPFKALHAVAKYRPTLFYGTPTAYIALLANDEELSKADFSCVRAAISSGSPLPQEVKQKFGDKTGVFVTDTWGMTESSPVLTCSPIGVLTKQNEIGFPVLETQVAVVTDSLPQDSGPHYAKPGEVGELVARGPQVMLGYWQKADATSQTIKNGWLYTGDLGFIDSNGAVYYLDRKKDIVNVGGLKVWPAEVEGVLYESPYVAEAVVGPRADEKYGEVVTAWVVLKPGISVEEHEIETALRDLCSSKLARFKVPSSINFVKEIPKTPVGKPLRRALRESS
jgi:long-chain acyl-CoA synthetase